MFLASLETSYKGFKVGPSSTIVLFHEFLKSFINCGITPTGSSVCIPKSSLNDANNSSPEGISES
jgi:hypothetical protein